MEEIQKLEAIQQRLNKFKQDQFEYWEEVRNISDDAEEADYQNQLPTILEEEMGSSEQNLLFNQILNAIASLREGEVRIVEQYKFELRQLALEIKELTKPMKQISTQTDVQPNYELLYTQEKQKTVQLEKKLLGMRKIEESNFKQEIDVELSTVRNKIQILTEASAEAEALLMKKDSQAKELQKQVQKLQRELTNLRGEVSIMHDQIRTKEASLRLAQNLNKNYELELSKSQNGKKQPAASVPKKPPQPCYQNLAQEIQELTHESQNMKMQIKKLKDQLQEKEDQLAAAERQLSSSSLASDELKEAMEYLEMKDMEIERLYKELEMYKRTTRDNQQVKDLQNLLLVMSRNLQEKEQIIAELSRTS